MTVRVSFLGSGVLDVVFTLSRCGPFPRHLRIAPGSVEHSRKRSFFSFDELSKPFAGQTAGFTSPAIAD